MHNVGCHFNEVKSMELRESFEFRILKIENMAIWLS